MRAILPLLIAVVAAAVVFFMTEAGAVEACIRASVTFAGALLLGFLIFRKRKGE